MRCYVLDKQLQLLPVGIAGELMVSGIQLAREYLHNPEKTAASFIPNPHNHDNHPHHQRMYRTGLGPRLIARIAGKTRKLVLCGLDVHSEACQGMPSPDAAFVLQGTWHAGC
jgi:acyl-CoA synthetase (AMP-forming)/AMP-acid ligase II